MASIYTQLFRDIFEESSKFLIHDFIELKGQIDNQKNRDDFCIHSYTKVFDVLMQLTLLLMLGLVNEAICFLFFLQH